MRVLLPWKKTSSDQEGGGGDSEDQQQQQQRPLNSNESPAPPSRPRKRPHHATMTAGRPEDRKPPASSAATKDYSLIVHENEPHDAYDEDDLAVFTKALKTRGLEMIIMKGDGNCLYRAVALQVYGDAETHGEVRQRCCDYMSANVDHFAAFLEEDFGAYIARKRMDGVHGNNPELQAISEIYNRPVEVFQPPSASPMNIFHSEYKTSDTPIRLVYHDGNHYNAVIDPYLPTAGLGLGMPGLQPGLADKLQLAQAKTESDRLADDEDLRRVVEESQTAELQRMVDEEDLLARAIKESSYSMDHMYQNKALVLSDLDATNFELEQTALEDSMEAYRQQEQGRKQRARRDGISVVSEAPQAWPTVSDNPAAAASLPSAAAPAAASVAAAAAAAPTSADEYPQTVQELVMNGFELAKVVHAYELIGDNFDDMLAFLMMNST